MINPLMMRLQNIFSSIGNQGNFGSPNGDPSQSPMTPDAGVGFPSVQDAGNDPTTGTDMSSVIANLFRPNDEQFKRLSDLSTQVPQHEQFKPDLRTKISAFMAGMGGTRPAGMYGGQPVGLVNDNNAENYKLSEAILDDKYNKAMEDYSARLKPLEELSRYEGQRNVNDRQIAAQMLREQDFNRKQTETERKNKEDEDIRRFRAEAYDFKTRNPDFKSTVGENGELVFYDPKDPTKVYYSGIQSGKLSDSDKINLQTEGHLKEIQARGEISKKLEAERQVNRTSIENLRFGNRQTLEQTKEEAARNLEGIKQTNRIAAKTTPSGNVTSPKAQSETQKKQGLINKALQIISEHPELKGYIIFEKNNAGTVQGVSIPKSGIFGDEAKRMKAYNLLFGQEPLPEFSGKDKNVTPQSAGAQKMRKEVPGHPGVFAVSTDGGKTWKVE